MPATARSTRVPVVSALLRNTDIAPSTTQNPCSTGNTCVTATASASPSPVRRLLRSTTALVARKPLVMAATATVSGITQSAAPVSGNRRPSTRAHTGLASAAAALRMIRPVTAMVADDGATVQQLAADLDRRRIVGLAQQLRRCRRGSGPAPPSAAR